MEQKMNSMIVAISTERLEELERKEQLADDAEGIMKLQYDRIVELEEENQDLRERLQIFGAGALELPEIPASHNMPLFYEDKCPAYEAEHTIEDGEQDEIRDNNG